MLTAVCIRWGMYVFQPVTNHLNDAVNRPPFLSLGTTRISGFFSKCSQTICLVFPPSLCQGLMSSYFIHMRSQETPNVNSPNI